MKTLKMSFFGCFHVGPFTDVMSEKTNSYAIQFHVKNIDTLNLWIENEGRGISQKLIDRFGRKVVGFTTLLEEIDL